MGPLLTCGIQARRTRALVLAWLQCRTVSLKTTWQNCQSRIRTLWANTCRACFAHSLYAPMMTFTLASSFLGYDISACMAAAWAHRSPRLHFDQHIGRATAWTHEQGPVPCMCQRSSPGRGLICVCATAISHCKSHDSAR